ncbi:MAG TPA: hypothetical protein VK171_11490 [Fimbriimonas sp.]|nr:hypothetical protein [Fimbriimonas sp.]
MQKVDWWKFIRSVALSPGGVISGIVVLIVFYFTGLAPLMQFVGLGAPSRSDVYILDASTGAQYNLDGTPRSSIKKLHLRDEGARFNLVLEFRTLAHEYVGAKYSVNGGEWTYLNAQSFGDSGIYKTYRGFISIGQEIDRRGIQIRVDAPSGHWRTVASTSVGTDADNLKWKHPQDPAGIAYIDQVTLGLAPDTYFATDEVLEDGTRYLGEHMYRPPVGFLNHSWRNDPSLIVKACEAITLVDAEMFPFAAPADLPESKTGFPQPDTMWMLPLPIEWRQGWVIDDATGVEEPAGTSWLRSLAHSTGIYTAEIVGKHTLHFPIGIPKLESTVIKPWKWDSQNLLEGYYLYSKDVETTLWNIRVKLPSFLKSKHIQLEAFDSGGKSLGRYQAYPTIHPGVLEARTLPMFSPTPLSKVEIYAQDIDQLPMIDGVVQTK